MNDSCLIMMQQMPVGGKKRFTAADFTGMLSINEERLLTALGFLRQSKFRDCRIAEEYLNRLNEAVRVAKKQLTEKLRFSPVLNKARTPSEYDDLLEKLIRTCSAKHISVNQIKWDILLDIENRYNLGHSTVRNIIADAQLPYVVFRMDEFCYQITHGVQQTLLTLNKTDGKTC